MDVQHARWLQEVGHSRVCHDHWVQTANPMSVPLCFPADVIMAPEEFDLAGETHEEPIAAMECIPVSLCVKVAGAHIAGW